MRKFNNGDKVRINYNAVNVHGMTGTVKEFEPEFETYTVFLDQEFGNRYFTADRLELITEPEISAAHRELLKLIEGIREKRTAALAEAERYEKEIDTINCAIDLLAGVTVE